MIVVDYSQVVISNLMAEIGNRTDVEIDINLLRHMVINSIRSYRNKFREYGELVIACDSRKYWRKEYFPYYKSNRKKAREDSGFNWPVIFDSINTIKTELKEFFPYRVIEVEGAEADDIIASLVFWSTQFDLKDEGTLVPEPKPLLILSGDHDFNQLQKYKHVKQFSPVQKKFVTPETTPEKYVIEHIIRGDKGDGIPNVLSADDCIFNGDRQKKIMTAKLEEWVNDPSTMPNDEAFIRNYQRNRALVDLTCIPPDVQEKIINTFTEYPKKDKSHILNYFIKNKMKMMIEHISEF